jgi:hypothetical protein
MARVSENERQLRMIERVQEDERLRGDLADTAATALVEWASQHVASAAADPDRPDAEVEADVLAIRAAARSAARAGEEEPKRLIALADAALAERQGKPEAPREAAASPSPAPLGQSSATATPQTTLARAAPPAAKPEQPVAQASQAHTMEAPIAATPPKAAPTSAALRRYLPFWGPLAKFLNRIRGAR